MSEEDRKRQDLNRLRVNETPVQTIRPGRSNRSQQDKDRLQNKTGSNQKGDKEHKKKKSKNPQNIIKPNPKLNSNFTS